KLLIDILEHGFMDHADMMPYYQQCRPLLFGKLLFMWRTCPPSLTEEFCCSPFKVVSIPSMILTLEGFYNSSDSISCGDSSIVVALLWKCLAGTRGHPLGMNTLINFICKCAYLQLLSISSCQHFCFG